MDEKGRKRSAGGLDSSRRSSSLSHRETNSEDQSIRYCTRLGCSARAESPKGTQVGSKEKLKRPKASFNCIRGKCIGGSSSNSSPPNLKKTPRDKTTNQRATEGIDSEGSEPSSRANKIQSVVAEAKVNKPPVARKLSALSSESSGSSSRNRMHPSRIGSTTLGVPSSSSSPSPRRPMPTRSSSCGTPQHGLKIIGCSPIPDVLPSGPSSDQRQSKRVSSVRKRPSERENLPVQVSNSIGASSSSSSSISVRKGPENPQEASRRVQYRPSNRNTPVSVRTRRPSGRPQNETQNQVTVSAVRSPSISYSAELSPVFQSSPDWQSNSDDLQSNNDSWSWSPPRSSVISSPRQFGNARVPSANRDGYRRFNIGGIAEIMSALNRIGHDELLTPEEMLMLEQSLFFGGLSSLHDQHREMRMDIDNMTYEELLALEERMGSVSTALSEEALSKCLERSKYVPSSKISGITNDDTKCSICQEEYNSGDEVGKLACDHPYHIDCIRQWLQLKNWCPICKSPAAPDAQEEMKSN